MIPAVVADVKWPHTTSKQEKKSILTFNICRFEIWVYAILSGLGYDGLKDDMNGIKSVTFY